MSAGRYANYVLVSTIYEYIYIIYIYARYSNNIIFRYYS